MALPTAKTVEKYSRRGVSIFLWLSAIADAENLKPARTELDGSTNLSAAIANISGFTLENQSIETPDMGDDFDSSIPGSDKAEDSSFTFYEDKVSDEIEQLLKKGTIGYVVILRKGDVPNSKSMDVFPVRVGSQSPAFTTDNEAAKFETKFTITRRPAQGLAVPAVGNTATNSTKKELTS
ncbi:phage tail tube protein [Streptomyces sp. IBSBF 2950]|uniref:phage tail tube protein n=1 Tax=Streptomyces sp. IBSBF 2950 TaxID=2903528 RepID=UPI002FDC6F84